MCCVLLRYDLFTASGLSVVVSRGTLAWCDIFLFAMYDSCRYWHDITLKVFVHCGGTGLGVPGVPRWQAHCRSGLATMPSVGAIP